eukprot:632867-Pyramimonas_sp.AAC.1
MPPRPPSPCGAVARRPGGVPPGTSMSSSSWRRATRGEQELVVLAACHQGRAHLRPGTGSSWPRLSPQGSGPSRPRKFSPSSRPALERLVLFDRSLSGATFTTTSVILMREVVALPCRAS